MALIIPTLKLGNKTTENAYAKVVRVSVDNNTKKASFNVVVYKSKEDRTMILSIPTKTIDTVINVDIIKQCYDSIPNLIAELDTKKNELEAKIDADSKDRKSIWDLSVLKANKLYYLVNATADI